MNRCAVVISGSALCACLSCGTNGEELEPSSAAAPYPVELSPPSYGLQVQTKGRQIPPGADEEWCEVVELSGDASDTYLVGRTEVAMAPYSHHLIVSVAPSGSSARLDAEPLGVPVRCSGAHQFGSDLVTLTGASNPYFTDSMPAGIGHVLHGGQRLLFDYHALNTSADPVPAAHRLNLHRVESIEKEARTFGFYNQYIEIPPHSARSFTDSCAFKDDVLVWALARHTHRHGTDFEVSWSGAREDESFWTSRDWESDVNFVFDEPVVVRAGTGFSWRCAFDNPTDETLIFGPEATDEMCILFGQFVSTDDANSAPPQSCYKF
jgi:hypothetical protein